MPIPRQGIRLVTKFQDLATQNFDTDLGAAVLGPNGTAPMADGEFWFRDPTTPTTAIRINSANMTHAVADNECAAVMGWANFTQRGDAPAQALSKVTLLYMGPYEAEFFMHDTDDQVALATVDSRVFVRRTNCAGIDGAVRGLIAASGLNVPGAAPYDNEIGWITRGYTAARGSVRVYVPNVPMPRYVA